MKPKYTDDIFGHLSKFNLSPYEIRVYKTLVLDGPLNATDVVKLSGIPQPRVYDTISNLEKKGMISTSSGIKKVYKANPPVEALSDKIKSLNSYLLELDNYVKENKRAVEIQKPNVWFLESRVRTLYSMEEMLEKSENEVIICTSYFRLRELFPLIKATSERGVCVCAVLFSDSPISFIDKLSKYAIVKRREGSPPEIIIRDRESSLINVSSMVENTNYSILVEESELIHIITYYFYYVLWEPAKYVSGFMRFKTLRFSTSWLACECIDEFLNMGIEILGDLNGYIGNEMISISGQILRTDRLSGIRHGFIIKGDERTYSVGGRNAKIEDIRMMNLTIREKTN
jgi:sugar-specific transcriptional regulator TrmB